MWREIYIGDREFYARVMRVAVPIMIQQGITSFVNMLDNIMVGRLGTDPMSGVAILNQLMFVFNLCIFGGLAGVGIFTAQFYGKRDHRGVRYTFRMQILLAFLLVLVGVFIFVAGGNTLIRLYLHEGSSGGDVEMTFAAAKRYLRVMLAGMLPFALTQAYSSTLRNTGETIVPMRAGIAAVIVNLVGNYILIYGKFGAPRLEVAGAAAATVLSRFVELAVVALWTHRNPELNRFIVGAYRHLFGIPADLIRRVAVKAAPLLMNEAMWAGGQAVLVQCYSVRGLDAIAAMNISQTIANVFYISFIAMGNAIAILLGQMLGAGELERARAESRKLTAFSVAICACVGVVQFAVGGFYPHIYNTTDGIRQMASGLIRISAACLPIYAYCNAVYFILRSGGKTGITFLFDSGFCWAVVIPLAFVLAHFTSVPILVMYLAVQLADLVKCAVGYVLVKSGAWAQDLTVYREAG